MPLHPDHGALTVRPAEQHDKTSVQRQQKIASARYGCAESVSILQKRRYHDVADD